MSKELPLIILAGPSGVGKSALSIALAKKIGGEIISADSIAIYKGLDIGSAKIKESEMEGIPHHLIDVLDVEENFNVFEFQRLSKEKILEISGRGRLPILVGGTGFYIQSILYNVDFETEEGGKEVREELEKLPAVALYERLCEIDAEAAKEIHPNNIKRVIRAIEFYELNGYPISKHNMLQRKKESPYNFRYFVLNRPRKELYARINKRVDLMMEEGILDEAKWLYDKHLQKPHTALSAIGYKEFFDYFEGRESLDMAIEKLKTATRHFAKRQITWFKRENAAIWLDASSPEAALSKILEICENV